MRLPELRAIAIAAVIAFAAGSCASPSLAPSAPPMSAAVADRIGLNNASTLPVTVTVNGMVVATVPAGAMQNPIATALPARPWTIEARSPSGRVLASLVVGSDAVVSDQRSIGDVEFLACGELVLWAGGPVPDRPRPVGPTPEPCD
jgi:hypothetical protein